MLSLLIVLYYLPLYVQAEKSRSCDVLIGIDEDFYIQHDRNMTQLVDLAQTHIDKVNQIYQQAVFVDDFANIYFRLARVQVMFGPCASFKYENCTENREKFLEIFDQYDFRDFCLGYMFTNRDFDAGTSGFASVGTACWETKNSGFITFINYARPRELNDTVITLAHEFGHSLGSKHDEEYEDEDCDDNFIMSSFLNQTTPDEFSNCSIRAIQEKLTEVLNSDRNCILEPRNTEVEIAVCGNGILEPGEQCDCGYDEISCNDPCCYPAMISQSDRDYNTTGALPCSTNLRKRCVNPPGLVYGIYIPLVFILIASILVIVLLKNDWSRDKTFFRHITHGNIKIVARKRQGVNGQSSEQEAGLSS